MLNLSLLTPTRKTAEGKNLDFIRFDFLLLTDLPGWYQREIIWFMSNKEEMIFVYKINQNQNKCNYTT